ncbi:MAG: hypothetical protein KAT69_04765 [Candidatus Aminicenantes bacterium]|nr:hypothetical protein [Candidatus Aminicenantes bacterium]
MREFTSTEVNLCKKIAEKEKRKVVVGDFFIDTFDKKKEFVACHTKLFTDEFIEEFGIPLWQEHNCLEWLLERGFYIERLGQDDECLWSLEIYELDDMGIIKGTRSTFEGESKLEPCLSAVLAVMEEK